MPNKTIAANYSDFERRVYPQGFAHPDQAAQIKRCFYAGVMTMQEQMMEVAQMDDACAEEHLKGLLAETQNTISLLIKPKAKRV